MRIEIIRMIAEVKQDPSLLRTVTGGSHLVSDLNLDSLQLIELILKVQEKFSVAMDFDSFEIEHVSSLDSFVQYISQLPRE